MKLPGSVLLLSLLLPLHPLTAAEPQPPGVAIVGFSDADYPPAALRAEEQGTTVATVMVGKDGRVTACEVRKSSGSTILDAATCDLLTKRSTFTAARDARGQPIAAEMVFPVSWRIPASSRSPGIDMTRFMRSTVTAVRIGKGGFQDCAVRVENAPADDVADADPCRPWSDGMLAQVAREWSASAEAPSKVTAVFQTGPFTGADVEALAGAMMFQGAILDPDGEECVAFSNVPIGGTTVSADAGKLASVNGRSCLIIASPRQIPTNLRTRGIGQWLRVTSEPLPAEPNAPDLDPNGAVTPSLTPDRFVVRTTARRLADGSVSDCQLEGLPSDGSCDLWTADATSGPGLFAATAMLGEPVRLALITDVRPWTGALQPLSYPGQREQVVLLGGETEETCARLSPGGPSFANWDEVTACPLTDDPAAFFAVLGDPRPRQSIWTLAAEPLPR